MTVFLEGADEPRPFFVTSTCYINLARSGDRAMNHPKEAAPAHPIHELIAKRWSPYAFEDRPVSIADLRSLFEAARWAPSSYNEQPWTYLVATRDQPAEFAKLLSCLVDGNQVWA